MNRRDVLRSRVVRRLLPAWTALAWLALASQPFAADVLRIRSSQLEIDALPGFSYQLQAVPDLAEPRRWENQDAPATVSLAGPVSWPLAPSGTQRYFRVEVRAVSLLPGQAEAEQRVVREVIQPLALPNLALGLRWPELLPAGAVIEPLANSDENPKRWTVEAPSFLFVLDHAPAQKLGHPFTYILVPQAGGALRQIKALSPPVVNGVRHLATLGERWRPEARFYPADFSSAPPLARTITLDYPPLQPDPTPFTGLSDETLRAFADAGTVSTGKSTVNCTNVVGKKIAVVVASGADDEIQNDARDMSALLGRLGFTVTDLNSKSNSLSQVISILQQAGAGLGPCDKFFFYISSHTQLVDDNDDGKPDSTPTRLHFGSGHNTGSMWAWIPNRPGTIPAVLQSILAGRVNIMMDTCFSESMAVLMRRFKAQLPAGVEWNIFESSSEFKTSAGATELDLYLDYGNNDVHSAYTSRILDKVKKAADGNTVDANGDGQVSIDEVEQTFLDAHFAAEEGLKDAQAPHFDRFTGAPPVAVGDTLIAPPARPTKVSVAGGDTLPPGTKFVLVNPPGLHSSLFSWDETKGELTVAGLTTIPSINFRYKLVAGPFETQPVSSMVNFDRSLNFSSQALATPSGKRKVPCLKIGSLLYPIYQFRLANNPLDVCPLPHWHAHQLVFPIDPLVATGMEDPNPGNCGFGTYQEVPREDFEVAADVWEKFLIDHFPPID